MKNYDQLEDSRQCWIEEDQELIEENRAIVKQIKLLKQQRQANLERRRFIAKQIKAHDYEIYN